MDTIIEAYMLFIFMTLTAILLLSMAVGFSPVDDWHIGLVVAGCALSFGTVIGLWLRSEK